MSPDARTRTLILSDVHLGRPNGPRNASTLERLVADFDRVIVNGDVAELGHEKYRKAARRDVRRLEDICGARAIRLDFIAGNHDPNVSPHRSMTLLDGAIYLTHGDAFHPAIAPWSPYSASMRRTFEEVLSRTPGHLAEDEARFAAAHEAAVSEWQVMGPRAHLSTLPSMLIRPHRLLMVLHYWWNVPQLAARWAECFAPEAGTIIVGHSHRAFVKTIGGRRVVDTGSFTFPGVPHGVVIENGEVSVHRILRDGPRYRLAIEPVERWRAEKLASPQRAADRGAGARGTSGAQEASGAGAAASTSAMNRPAFARSPRSTSGR